MAARLLSKRVKRRDIKCTIGSWQYVMNRKIWYLSWFFLVGVIFIILAIGIVTTDNGRSSFMENQLVMKIIDLDFFLCGLHTILFNKEWRQEQINFVDRHPLLRGFVWVQPPWFIILMGTLVMIFAVLFFAI